MEYNIKSSLTHILGFWSAIVLGVLFVLYAVCFIGILAGGPMFIWTDMSAFLESNRTHDQTLKYVSYAGMLLLGVVYIVLTECISETAPQGGKLFSRLGTAFGIMFALSTGINYSVQLVTVRLKLADGAYKSLDQLIMSDPISAMASINMLGWTFLLGISTLCLGFALHGVPKAKAALVCLITNAVVCISGGVGYVMNNKLIVGLCMYPLLGGTVMAVAVSLAALFRRLGKSCDLNHGQAQPKDYNDHQNRDNKTNPY